ncbi:MAG: hypothetical protein D6807_07250, partial [Alphaproteobacteria bacterium]
MTCNPCDAGTVCRRSGAKGQEKRLLSVHGKKLVKAVVVTVAWAFVLLGAAGSVDAQPLQQIPVSGGVIEGIAVRGNQRIEPATVASYLTVRIGDPFDPAALDESLKRLFATGLFADVSFDRSGNTLIINVTENPIINRIIFEGNK